MHYLRHYGSMPFLEAERAAIADAREYAGEKTFAAIVEAARTYAPLQFRMALSFLVGIEGYPAGALLREYNPATNETGDYGELPD